MLGAGWEHRDTREFQDGVFLTCQADDRLPLPFWGAVARLSHHRRNAIATVKGALARARSLLCE